ncbi:hypothetical protein S7335_3446 [Synechococcus sp. PCC 7335]|nr:hypothetical protein S7335_3446 [Synechococcus sp. PCC 7335]
MHLLNTFVLTVSFTVEEMIGRCTQSFPDSLVKLSPKNWGIFLKRFVHIEK